MILCGRDVTVEPSCDNVVGLVFGNLWPAIIFHLCFVYFDHNGGSTSFLTEGNQKILIHKKKSRFPFFATAHRKFEIFNTTVLDFCGVQSLAEAKGLGRSMDCSFMRTVRSGTVKSFCIRTQKQWENEMALLLERDSILQGMLMRNSVSFLHHAEREGRKVTTTRNASLQRNISKCNGM